MHRTDKDVVIGELQEKLNAARAFYLTDFTGMNVKQITEFRSRLRKQGLDYVVVKNTFQDRPAVKVGVVDGREFNADQVKKLADMPPREVLLAQIAGGLQAPMARLVGGMSQLVAGFARAVDQLRQQREGAAA